MSNLKNNESNRIANLRIEDYKFSEAKELEKLLRKKYKINSDSTLLIGDLKAIGFSCSGFGDKVFRGRMKIVSKDVVVCNYTSKESWESSWIEWGVILMIDDNKRIQKITVETQYYGP